MHQRRHKVFQRKGMRVQKVAENAMPLTPVAPDAHKQDL